jgi:hypothetical protein
MGIELHVEIKVLDTEPENPMNEGIVLRAARVTTLQSEIAEMGAILAITGAVSSRVTDEVKQDILDQLEIITRQPE